MRYWEHLDLLTSLFYFSTYRINCKLKNKSIGNKRGLKNVSLQIPATAVGVVLDLNASIYPVTKRLAIVSVNHRSCAKNMILNCSMDKCSKGVLHFEAPGYPFFRCLQGSKGQLYTLTRQRSSVKRCVTSLFCQKNKNKKKKLIYNFKLLKHIGNIIHYTQYSFSIKLIIYEVMLIA